MILSVLTFDLRPGSLETLEEVFRRHRIFERASQTEGCRVLYLASGSEDGSRAHVIGVWDDEAAYQRWLDHPERGLGSEDLHSITSDTWDASAPGEVWRVLHTVSSPVAEPASAAGG